MLGSLGGVTGLATALGLWLRDLPNARSARDRSERCTKLAILAPALQRDAPAERAVAVRFLLASGIAHDEGKRVESLASRPESIPKLDAAVVTSVCGAVAHEVPGQMPVLNPPNAPSPSGDTAGADRSKIEVRPASNRSK